MSNTTLALTTPRALTSASNIYRRKLCPGSARLERGFGEQESEYSEEGTMLHTLFLTGKRPENLTAEQVEVLNLADYYAEAFFDDLRVQFAIPAGANFVQEREVGMIYKAPDGSPLFPGHADVIRNWPEFGVRAIADAKFGITEVAHAADNLQLASYAIMRHQQSPSKAIGVAIIQPRNFGPRVSSAVYLAQGIPGADAEIRRVITASEAETAPLMPSLEACQFCRAKASCPAFQSHFLGIERTAGLAIQSLTDGQLEKLYVSIAYAAKISDEVRHEMRARAEVGGMAGWSLKNTGETRVCHNPMGLFLALKTYFNDDPAWSAKEFDACRELRWGALESYVMRVSKMNENKAKEFLRTFSEPFVKTTAKAKSIARAK